MVTKVRSFLALLVTWNICLPEQALVQEPEVRLWTPYADSGRTFECIAADLADWLRREAEEGAQLPVPHRLIDLPEGRYLDQIMAAADTGELPELLLAPVELISALPDLAEGPLFGADLIGIWVDELRLAGLPAAQAGAATLWRGNGGINLSTFDEVLLLLQTQGHLAFGLDVGRTGEDLGLGLAIMLTQWSLALDNSEMPNWSDSSLKDTLVILKRWQQEGLMREVDLTNSGEQAIFTLGRLSMGLGLDPDRRFYPLFGGVAGKGSAFLELDVNWYTTRPNVAPLYSEIIDAATNGQVFSTCAETAGLLSYQQFVQLGEEEVMRILGPRRGEAIGLDIDVAIETWTGARPELPGALADLLRDIRAGLSIDIALERLP